MPAPALDQFNWKPQPEAQTLVTGLLAAFLQACPPAAALADRMRLQAGTRFQDWVDSIEVATGGIGGADRARLESVGFTRRPLAGAPEHFIHPGAMFPSIVLTNGPATRVFIKADSVADFLATHDLDHPIDGEPLAQFRRARVYRAAGAELWVCERHGYRGFDIPHADPARAIASQRHLEALRKRRRDFPTDAEGFAHARSLTDAAVSDLGVDWACDTFFYAERDYWQKRNRAARVQRARQDRLGLGWANHDHHTYRSSRHAFTDLVGVFEKLGFKCRERFYAGAEAGWGAQVLEQPTANITIFADVDMSPEELLGDFSHQRMADRKELGTVGLWCALHGEAFLQAGMHHLECQFDWHALKDQLQAESINTMDPFTTFPFLRQAFTEGERWRVAEPRIAALLARGQITTAQAEQFRAQGAIGSHLENLERNDGYKGFNQKGVSDIIAKTDPRKQTARAGA